MIGISCIQHNRWLLEGEKMIRIYNEPVIRRSDELFTPTRNESDVQNQAYERTISWKILEAHNLSRDDNELKLKFDLLASPDDNYACTLQEVRAMGCKEFRLPWIFTNGHNALACAGGTVNNDDHIFGHDCAKKYGGIYVPPYCAVIHQYIREEVAAAGQLILASDSHTRYGCLGAMGIGEGGTEIARQAMGSTYDIRRPQVIALCLKGAPAPWVGPMDLALTLIGNVFRSGFCKNKILEVVGPGIANLSMDFRFGFDAMTTETACLSTVWSTDETVRDWLSVHKRPKAYKKLEPEVGALYDGLIEVDLSSLEPMIALPFHPANVFSIRSLNENESYLRDVLALVEKDAAERSSGLPFTLQDKVEHGRLRVQQASIAGCVGGTFENIAVTARLLDGYINSAEGIPLGIYPASQAVLAEADKQGIVGRLIRSGATIHPCICGPCFGTTDIPANNTLAIRHVTRNYFGREGAKPHEGQLCASALMDARSIATTVRNRGTLTSAAESDIRESTIPYGYDRSYYDHAVVSYFGRPQAHAELRMGPNIKDWPELPAMGRHLLLKVAGRYAGSVTTDELCPSGEASSQRSNPAKISQYTLISRDKDFVKRALDFRDSHTIDPTICEVAKKFNVAKEEIFCGNLLMSDAIGDGSSREQAVSNQKVLGTWANIAMEYSTKRYRSNCINWGVIPLQISKLPKLSAGDYLFLPNVRANILSETTAVSGYIWTTKENILFSIGEMTAVEREILSDGGLINHYRKKGL